MTFDTRYIIDTGPKINTFGLELRTVLIRKDKNQVVVLDYKMKGVLDIFVMRCISHTSNNTKSTIETIYRKVSIYSPGYNKNSEL